MAKKITYLLGALLIVLASSSIVTSVPIAAIDRRGICEKCKEAQIPVGGSNNGNGNGNGNAGDNNGNNNGNYNLGDNNGNRNGNYNLGDNNGNRNGNYNFGSNNGNGNGNYNGAVPKHHHPHHYEVPEPPTVPCEEETEVPEPVPHHHYHKAPKPPTVPCEEEIEAPKPVPIVPQTPEANSYHEKTTYDTETSSSSSTSYSKEIDATEYPIYHKYCDGGKQGLVWSPELKKPCDCSKWNQ